MQLEIGDLQLSEHFTLFELTKTNRSEFQACNRKVSEGQVNKLRNVAVLLELCRSSLDAPIIVHSGYRCPDLNRAVGSSDRSQHLLCEAVDFSVKGLDVEHAFRILRADAHNGRLPFGQLIFEKAARAYGLAEWLHISLGIPYRIASKSGQVLTMNEGKYHLMEVIKQA